MKTYHNTSLISDNVAFRFAANNITTPFGIRQVSIVGSITSVPPIIVRIFWHRHHCTVDSPTVNDNLCVKHYLSPKRYGPLELKQNRSILTYHCTRRYFMQRPTAQTQFWETECMNHFVLCCEQTQISLTRKTTELTVFFLVRPTNFTIPPNTSLLQMYHYFHRIRLYLLQKC